MKKIKRIGNIIWGTIYITGGLVGTMLVMPLIIGVAIFNLIKK